MARGTFTFTFTPEDALQSAIEDYGQWAGQLVQEVYEEVGAEHLKRSVVGVSVFPVSGRRFRGHPRGAKEAGTKIFTHAVNGLDLTITAGGKWGYLIFPDEGRGVHNPKAYHFMMAGLEKASTELTERILARLTE